ncbi:MAG TPA: thiamine phosphate synthase [Longimicrobiales bacterium]|nr:thiamine phosphate synthase [Longimicrobiales bacterium]
MIPRLHLVTDDRVLARPDFPDIAAAVLQRCGPHAALHVRGHSTPARRLYEVAAALSVAALRAGSWLIVNDRIDIAMAVRANGVQLGVRSLDIPDARRLLGAGARIGYSAHSAPEAATAAALGADWIFAGSIYPTASHPEGTAAGLDLLRATADGVGDCPVIAIGGVTADRVAVCLDAGAYGVAVLRGAWEGDGAGVGEYLGGLGVGLGA